MTVEDVTWAAPDGVPLLARLYRPEGPAPAGGHPAVVEVHGGAWAGLDRTVGVLYCQALARAGFVVASIDFRQGPAHRHPAASADVAAAVRWLRAEPGRWGVDPLRIGLVGSSSGGHLALLAALDPHGSEHGLEPGVAGVGVAADVRCVAALWPPVDPLARYRYACDLIGIEVPEGDRFRPDLLVAGTEAYFGDEAAMADASVAARVRAGRHATLPPVWVAHPELDRNVPRLIVDALAQAWSAAGGAVSVTTYPGEVHAFGHRPGPSTPRFVADLVAFCRHHLAA